MKGLRVLVVDDEPGARDCFVRLLRYRGCEVCAAKNTEEVFAALRRGPPYDVAIVDLVMPGMEGLRVIREMQSMDLALRFVVVSGKLVSSAERLVLAGLGVCFCAKPFNNEELLLSVGKMAQRAERPRVANATA